jgi:hypothetical protein
MSSIPEIDRREEHSAEVDGKKQQHEDDRKNERRLDQRLASAARVHRVVDVKHARAGS